MGPRGQGAIGPVLAKPWVVSEGRVGPPLPHRAPLLGALGVHTRPGSSVVSAATTAWVVRGQLGTLPEVLLDLCPPGIAALTSVKPSGTPCPAGSFSGCRIQPALLAALQTLSPRTSQ